MLPHREIPTNTWKRNEEKRKPSLEQHYNNYCGQNLMFTLKVGGSLRRNKISEYSQSTPKTFIN